MSDISGVEIALWDIIGRRAASRSIRLLGGRYHERMPSHEVVPGFVEVEVAVPRLTPAAWVGVGCSAKTTQDRGPL